MDQSTTVNGLCLEKLLRWNLFRIIKSHSILLQIQCSLRGSNTLRLIVTFIRENILSGDIVTRTIMSND